MLVRHSEKLDPEIEEFRHGVWVGTVITLLVVGVAISVLPSVLKFFQNL